LPLDSTSVTVAVSVPLKVLVPEASFLLDELTLLPPD